jgi:hypothetical protein
VRSVATGRKSWWLEARFTGTLTRIFLSDKSPWLKMFVQVIGDIEKTFSGLNTGTKELHRNGKRDWKCSRDTKGNWDRKLIREDWISDWLMNIQ